MRVSSGSRENIGPSSGRWLSRALTAAAPCVVVGGAFAYASACSPGPYECTTNVQCMSASNVQGVCDESGFCAYPDTTCTMTGLRYSVSAGNGLASSCVATESNACIQQLAVGQDTACYVRTDGSVWCWGWNQFGQVGDGTTTDRNVPTQVQGLPMPAVLVSVAEMHVCAELMDGTIWCWGINDQSNLGQCKSGSELTQSPTPLQVFYASVTLPKGEDPDGGKGDAGAPIWTCGSKPLVAAVPSGSLKNSLTLGGEHSCVVDQEQKLYCWGENVTSPVGGQAGQDFNVIEPVEGPLVVDGTDPTLTDHIIDIESGDDFTCLESDTQSVYCWGGNQLGELADNGARPWASIPQLIGGFGGVQQLLVDDETACVVTVNGSLWCWGNGEDGIFGPANNPTGNALTPVNLGTATAVFGGPNAETVCTTNGTGVLQCWGSNSKGEAAIGSLTPVSVTTPTTALLSSVAQLRIGQDHGCALTETGELFCFGDNTHGELGDGTTSTTPNPVPTPVKVMCP